MAIRLRYGEPLTVGDLSDRPDDGHRYELVDGTLVVTPSPGRRHQGAAFQLARVLDDAAPSTMEVLMAPFDWIVGERSLFEPDVLVARRDRIDEDALRVAPELVVEVLSPSTRAFDLGVKRLAYEAAGVPAYWVVDPLVPSLLVLERVGSELVEVSRVEAAEEFTSTTPFAVTVVPSALVDRPTDGPQLV